MSERQLPDDWSAWRDQVDLDRYDERWAAMEAAGQNPHGEADLVQAVLSAASAGPSASAGLSAASAGPSASAGLSAASAGPSASAGGPRSVLDGGCGTGRVAIELARRGLSVVGVDPDPDMIAAAREKAPDLRWVRSSLEELDLDERFDVVVLAGNVIPYATDRAGVVAGCARHLVPGGSLVAGFALQPGWPTLDEYDDWCAAAALTPADRWSTWSRDPFEGGDYAVSRHVRNG